MTTRHSGIWRAFLLTATICSLSFPAYAKYGGGSGEPNDPYQIATAEDLMLLGESPEDYDKHFILTADIDLDPNLPGRKVFDKAVIAPDTDPNKLNFQGTIFTGVFDGNGNIVWHLTIEGEDYLGLFGQSGTGAKIFNFGLKLVNINGTGICVGSLVGMNRGSITTSHSTGMVTGYRKVGGLVGDNRYGSIIASYGDGTVRGDYNVGGLVGHTWHGSITASYSTGTVTGVGLVGGLVGNNSYGNITVSYSSGTVIGDGSVGGLVGTNSDGEIIMSHSTGTVIGGSYYSVGGLVGRVGLVSSITDSFWDIETSGQTESAGGEGKTTAEMQMESTFTDAGWDFVDETTNGTCDYWQMSPGHYPRLCYQTGESPMMPEGLGTGEQPYLIRDARDLGTVWFKPLAHYLLEASVDLSGITWSMAVVPWFEGTFYGNDHTISHLKIEGGSYLGLFGQLGSDAKISNLGLKVVDVNGTGNYIGGLVGENNGSIIKAYGTGTISGSWYVGGLVGCNSQGGIAVSYSTGTVAGYIMVGGLVGRNLSSITSSFSSSTIRGFSSVGGLVGSNSVGLVSDDIDGEHGNGSITTSYSNCKVKGSGGSSASGLVGSNYGSITSSYSSSTVKGYSSDSLVGGLVGYNLGSKHGNGSIITSFWDIETSFLRNMCASQQDEARGCDDSYGKNTSEMQRASTFLEAGWDFVGETVNGIEDVWWILEGKDYPRLWWQYGRAFSAYPQDGAVDVVQPLLLGWLPGGAGLGHDIYFGEDKEAVTSATTESLGIYRGRQTPQMTAYDPGALRLGKTYYWRIDEVKADDTIHKGDVWSFTVADYLIVDDFESYTDDEAAGEAIYQTWIDGFGIADNGSQVGYLFRPYCEQTIVHGGLQSMPLLYVNEAGVTNSEATLTLTAPRDWIQAGVSELSLWFQGSSSNAAEPLYIEVSSSTGASAVVTHDDGSAAMVRSWVQWRIPLQAFADLGINLADVDTLAFGLGSKGGAALGGSGTMYIDDIRLYASFPEIVVSWEEI